MVLDLRGLRENFLSTADSVLARSPDTGRLSPGVLGEASFKVGKVLWGIQKVGPETTTDSQDASAPVTYILSRRVFTTEDVGDGKGPVTYDRACYPVQVTVQYLPDGRASISSLTYNHEVPGDVVADFIDAANVSVNQ